MKSILYCALFVLVVSCAGSKKTTESNYQKEVNQLSESFALKESDSLHSNVIPTVNFSLRKPNYVIIHHTEQESCAQTYRTFENKQTQVSAHYVICSDGQITQMLSDYLRAWHAGRGRWHTLTDMNSTSIGIELDNDGEERFSTAQIESLIRVLSHLTNTFNIPPENIIGHLDWAPGRKVDPSKYFPWEKLYEAGYGIWYDESQLDSISLPVDFDPVQSLYKIGYDIRNVNNAIQSFKIHFLQDDSDTELSDEQLKVLYLVEQGLYKKSMEP